MRELAIPQCQWYSDRVHSLGYLAYLAVWTLASSADERFLYSGSEDKTVKVWSTEDASLKSTLSGHTEGVRSVVMAFQFLASASLDSTIRLWDVELYSVCSFDYLIQREASVITLLGHSDGIHTLECVPSQNILGSGARDRTIRLWDLRTNHSVHLWECSSEVTSLTYAGIFSFLPFSSPLCPPFTHYKGGNFISCDTEGNIVEYNLRMGVVDEVRELFSAIFLSVDMSLRRRPLVCSV